MDQLDVSVSRRRASNLEFCRERSRRGAEIGEIPPVVDPERRAKGKADLNFFLVTYFPFSTGLSPFSDDHNRVIGRIQDCVLRGGRFVNAVYRGFAKALDIATPIPTPGGFVPMGDLAVGDTVFDETGRECRIVNATPIMENADCFAVRFDDGEEIICSGDHLWTVNDGATKKKTTIDTRTMFKEHQFVPGNRKNRFSVDVAGACEFRRDFNPIISPYVLGYWLGDGTTANNQVTIGDRDLEEVVSIIESEGESIAPTKAKMRYLVGGGLTATTERFEKCMKAVSLIESGASVHDAAAASGVTYATAAGIKHLGRWRNVGGKRFCQSRPSLRCRLREIGVLGRKHIPEQYLSASKKDRFDLLQGLLDSDGTCSKLGHSSFSNKNLELCNQVRILLWSLGIKNTIVKDVIGGKDYYKVNFTCHRDTPCFRISRKRDRQKIRPAGKTISGTRRIVSVSSVETRPVRCIEVDSPNKLYLCGRSFVPTHNSTISELALLWAILHGHRRFGAIFAAESSLADKAISSIRAELSDNDLLFEDFPEACFPIRALEGKPQRAAGQTINGERTHIHWKGDMVVLPTIAGSVCSGSVIMSRGLTASILGLRWKTNEGYQLRPDFTIVDDPQTRESARSPSQCHDRLDVLTKSVMKLSGHNRQMACVVNATVIETGDMVDQLLDSARFPAWQGERIPMVRKFSDRHDDLWMEKYKEIRCTFHKGIVGDQARAHREANEFYLANRAEMDAGCEVSWESCFDPDTEFSSIQHAYNALIDDGAEVFASEFQQMPIRAEDGTAGITPKLVTAKTIPVPRFVVPRGLDTLTAFIDVQEKLLYWAVVAWGHELRGHLVAYDVFPEQNRSYYTLRDAKKTLSMVAENASIEASIHNGLDQVTKMLFAKEFIREDDATVLKIGQVFVDANWAQTQGVVRDFCRRSTFGPRLLPTHGRFVGASGQTLSDKAPDRGERIGANWRTSSIGRQRHVLYDTNAWKTFLSGRVHLPAGDKQGFTFHAGDHEMIGEHFSAETPVRTESRQRIVDEWRTIPGRDNHWFDCVVGASVAASYLGISSVGVSAGPAKLQRKVVTKEEMAAKREALLRLSNRQ